jgi:hypothetical protein
VETIVDGYREEGVDGTLANKWGNVTKLVGQGDVEGAIGTASDRIDEGDVGEALTALRLPRFFSLLPLLGILLVGPVAMLVARLRGPREGLEWRFALLSFGYCALVSVVWALLMFGNPDSSTLIHVGTLALPLLAICACVAGAYAVDPRLAVGMVGLNALLVLILYVPALTPQPGTSYSVLAAVLAAISLGGFAAVALRKASP